MNRRRYDDVVKFVASIVFGTSFREFSHVIVSLKSFGCSNTLAILSTAAFYLVFFRNVHGLIAYDLWADHSQYEPQFEHRPRHVFGNFLFALLGSILLPYGFIFVLTEQPNWISQSNPGWVICPFLFLPILIYAPWNLFWLSKLRRYPLVDQKLYQTHFPKARWVPFLTNWRRTILSLTTRVLDVISGQSTFHGLVLNQSFRILEPIYNKQAKNEDEYRAFINISDFTILWCLIDALWLILFTGLCYAMFPYDVPAFCLLYVIIAPLVLLLDYCSHVNYYFPIRTFIQGFYEFPALWEYILPDGIKFCHWGGKNLSLTIVEAMSIESTDRIIELCCGHGGTLSLLPEAKRIVGVDRSMTALEEARKFLQRRPVELLCADVLELPYPDRSFTKLFVQDGDAWLCADKDKRKLMAEIFRITDTNGLFFYQSYVRYRDIPEYAEVRTRELLVRCGYRITDVPYYEDIPRMFSEAGFRVKSVISLHEIYQEDNNEMLRCFYKNQAAIRKAFLKRETEIIEELLNWEKQLFLQKWWSGILVVAKRP